MPLAIHLRNKTLLKEMFSEMVLQKEASLIPKYYHKGFLLYTNGQEMNYESFLESHKTYYQTCPECLRKDTLPKQEPSNLVGESPADKERSEFHVLASIAGVPVTVLSERMQRITQAGMP